MPKFTKENLPKILAMLREQNPDPSDDEILNKNLSQITSNAGSTHQTAQKTTHGKILIIQSKLIFKKVYV